MPVEVGILKEKTFIVSREQSASHLGSGAIAVYATPALALHMEETCVEAVDRLLGEGLATVGASISVRHLAPTPVGMEVRIRAELVRIDGRSLHFRIDAYDEVEHIGEAEHERVVIDRDRFSRKAALKKSLARGAHQGEKNDA